MNQLRKADIKYLKLLIFNRKYELQVMIKERTKISHNLAEDAANLLVLKSYIHELELLIATSLQLKNMGTE